MTINPWTEVRDEERFDLRDVCENFEVYAEASFVNRFPEATFSQIILHLILEVPALLDSARL